MDEEQYTLIKEGPGGDTIHGGSVSLDALARRSEPAKGVVRRQTDGPDDRDVGLEVGPAELGS